MTSLRLRRLATLLASCVLTAISVPAFAGDAMAPLQSCDGLHEGAPCKNGGDAGDQGGVCLSEMCSVPNFLCDGAVTDSGNGSCGTVSTPCMLCEVQSHTPIPEGGLQPGLDASLGGPDAATPSDGAGATTKRKDAGSHPRDAATDAQETSSGAGGCTTSGRNGGAPSGAVSLLGLAVAVVASRRRR